MPPKHEDIAQKPGMKHFMPQYDFFSAANSRVKQTSFRGLVEPCGVVPLKRVIEGRRERFSWVDGDIFQSDQPVSVFDFHGTDR